MKDSELNILIVDDRPENLFVLESLLEPLDINIVKAYSGNEALGLMLEHDFFLVLMDVQMPEMNGFETAELMRGSHKTANTPIIFVTAISKEKQYVFKGYELGAIDYLFKPIEPIILISKVKVFMEIYKKTNLLKKQTELLEQKIEELINLRESNYKLEKLSLFDALTGIANRRSFDETVEKEWKLAIKEQGVISVIMMDIDFFKQYNDTYGHLQGDSCLKLVGAALAECTNKEKCFVARYGGEEFVIVLTNTDKERAKEVAEEVREKIESLKIEHQNSKVSKCVTISLGVNTVYPVKHSNLVEFLSGADEALYKAKQSGRNKVCFLVD